MDKDTVLATITEEEIERFIDLESETEAIRNTIFDLMAKRAELYRERSKHWKYLREKYVLPISDLTVNHETREIRFMKN